MLLGESKPYVSVVVPMYNVENYLEHCVRSILNQTLSDLEVILVDDASPDRSGEIADQLALNDARIRVVHRACNGGLGPARNSGLEVAHGEYVMFVDSDDWIEPDMATVLCDYSSDNDLDICFTGRRFVTDGVVVKRIPHPLAGAIISGTETSEFHKEFYGPLPGKSTSSPIPVSAWAALYRTAFLNRENLRFIDIRSEDMIFNILAVDCAEKIGFCAGEFYNYRKDNQPSITTSASMRSVQQYFVLFDKLLELAGNEPPGIREECVLRANRRIIDVTRSALRVNQHSNNSRAEKRAVAYGMLYNPILRHALSLYPIWHAPFSQALFSLFMKARCVGACELLAKLRGGYA